MLNRLLLTLTGLLFAAAAWAVDVNTAHQAALESLKGLGPAQAAAIIAERDKNGPYKDVHDLATRVKGVRDKKVQALMQAGLTIGNPEDQKVGTGK